MLSVDGIGPGKIRNLLAEFHSIENALAADYNSLLKAEGISSILAQRIVLQKKLKDEFAKTLQNELNILERVKGRIVTVWDEDYPPILKRIFDPPLLLYYKGNFEENDNYSIAVVGTRQPTNYGKVQAEKITAELSSQKITIVSGLARGIDSIAHSTALKNGNRTIAVIGSGIDIIYPAENRRMFDAISEKGLIISEFPPGTKPDAQNFPKRNRLISGLSLGTIVIETAITGGAMQTAALSLDQNREVFAVPGNLGSDKSEGTNLLIQKCSAKLIRSAEDVLVELDLKLKPILGKNIPKVQLDLNLFEEKILAALENEAVQIDNIAASTNLSTADCLVQLLSLEFTGLVKQLPGKMFARL